MDTELSVEERNLLSVAYKNAIGSRRTSWRIVSLIEQKKDQKDHETQIKEYRQNIEKELYGVCHDILDLLSTALIPRCKPDNSEALVFYSKMYVLSWLERVTIVRSPNLVIGSLDTLI